MLLHPDRLFPADPSARKIARELYTEISPLPLVSPHGHTQAGWFAKNDRPAPGVRVYLEDGSFATTDLNGEFSFPSVRPGMHVVRVDPLTLPKSAKRASDAPMNSPQSLQRLLHGVLDDGTMEDVEFALEPQS